MVLQQQTKTHEESTFEPKILIITTVACSYPGADNAGQKHLSYPTSTYIIRVPDPVMFPISFYIKAFEMGYDGIIIASCGTDCPYKGTYDRLAKRVDEAYKVLREKNIHYSRLALTAICTVCADRFVKVIDDMYTKLKEDPSILKQEVQN